MPITTVSSDPNAAGKNLASLGGDVKEEIALPTITDAENKLVGDALLRGSFFYEVALGGKTFNFATLTTDQIIDAYADGSIYRRQAEVVLKAKYLAAKLDPNTMTNDDITQVANTLSTIDVVARHTRLIDGDAVNQTDAFAFFKTTSPIIVTQLYEFIKKTNEGYGNLVQKGIVSDANIKKSQALA